MPTTAKARELLKSFSYEGLLKRQRDIHWEKACRYYKGMIEEAEPQLLAPFVIHLALSGRQFPDLRKCFNLSVSEAAKSSLAAYDPHSHAGRHLFSDAGDPFLHAAYAMDAFVEREEGAEALADMWMGMNGYSVAKVGVETLHNPACHDDIRRGIQDMVYSGLPLYEVKEMLGPRAMDEFSARRVFLELVKDAVLKVAALAVTPPMGRAAQSARAFEGLNGQR